MGTPTIPASSLPFPHDFADLVGRLVVIQVVVHLKTARNHLPKSCGDELFGERSGPFDAQIVHRAVRNEAVREPFLAISEAADP